MWKSLKQLRFSLKQRRTSHFSHFVSVWFSLQTLHLPLFGHFTGQWAIWSILTATVGWKERRFGGFGNAWLFVLDGGRPADLEAEVLTFINETETFAWNLRWFNISFRLIPSSWDSLRYRSQALIRPILMVYQNMYRYHLFDFMWYLYLARKESSKSTPPIKQLYSETIFGLSISTNSLLDLLHLLTLSSGCGPKYDESNVTALVSYHLTAVSSAFCSTRQSNAPLPFSFKLFSSRRLQFGNLLLRIVPT